MGVVGGTTASRYLASQHQHATSVMWLSQFHFDRFAGAVRQRDCVAGANEVQALHVFADEVALAFPLADAQDPVFHGYLKQLQQSLMPTTVMSGQCEFNNEMLVKVREACADCHRDYR